MTYTLLKNKINKGQYKTQEEMQDMLDVFLIGERISTAEYQELTALLKSHHIEE